MKMKIKINKDESKNKNYWIKPTLCKQRLATQGDFITSND